MRERPRFAEARFNSHFWHPGISSNCSTFRPFSAQQYRWSSANFKISPRKLNMLAKQIRHLPINEAITQMEFSQKRASRRILNNLAFARKNMGDQEAYKMDSSRVVVGGC